MSILTRAIIFTSVLTPIAHAGGGPMNVLVLYNGEIPDALDVAQYYADQRSIPDAHLCALAGIGPDVTQVSFEDYQRLIHDPLDACLDGLPQPDEIDYLVLIRGLPYRVQAGDFTTSLSAMLQIHHTTSPRSGQPLAGQPQPRSGAFYAWVDNPLFIGGRLSDNDTTGTFANNGAYVTSTQVAKIPAQVESFTRDQDLARTEWDFSNNLFVVTRLDGFDFNDARDLVDRAVAADGTFPGADFLCMTSADAARGVRDADCKYAIGKLESYGVNAKWLDAFDGALAGESVIAYFTGAAGLTDAIDGQAYAPGALACNLTSFGATPPNFFCSADGTSCPENESQTAIARFVRAGATGAHGTVNEPLNNSFPNAGTLLMYALGYNLGESFFFNQPVIYWQNLVVGDPLTTPFAERPTITTDAMDPQPVNRPVALTGSHPDGVREVRLYQDGVLLDTAEGDTLLWTPSGAPGDVASLMVVAIAADVSLEIDDWPGEATTVRARTQGWASVEVTLGEPVADETPTNRGEGPRSGCQSVPVGTDAWLTAILACVLVSIRRRDQVGT
ncbi:MAG: TIGR03790 family protein [Myxococcota bacterium]